jgi:hypothetical protein
MEEVLRYERQLDVLLKQETNRLLSLGYTQEQINALDDALEYISYPILAAYYKNPHQVDEEINNPI